MSPRLTLFSSAAGCAGSIALHYERHIDWRLQEIFYRHGGWLIDENEPIKKAIFYKLPKAALIAFGLAILARIGVSFYKRTANRWGYVFLLVAMGLIPALVSFAKQATNEACPKELFLFGGPVNLANMAGECFPGGHSSGGFALLALYWCANRKLRWLLPGLLAGGVMGLYQMAKGAHFLSDTTCALFFALLTAELISRMFKPESLELIRA